MGIVKVKTTNVGAVTLSTGVDNVTVMSSVGSASINNDTLYLDFPVAETENFTFSLNNQTVNGASISGADVTFDNGIANISITGAETFTLNGAEVSAVSITGGAEVNFDNNTALVSIGGGTSSGGNNFSVNGAQANAIYVYGGTYSFDSDTKVASISLSYASENDLDDTGTSIASAGFVNAVIRRLVGNAPSALDTLGELAAALNNDDDFAATVTNLISQKQDQLNITNFAANLLKCNSAAELRSYWAGIKDFDFDEAGNSWGAVGSPYMSKTNAKFNKALQLNGSSYLATLNTFELGGNNSFALEGFFKVNSTTDFQVVIGLYDYTSNGDLNYFFSLCVRNGNFFARFSDYTTAEQTLYDFGNYSADLVNHFFALTYSNGVLGISIDGAETTQNYNLPQSDFIIGLGCWFGLSYSRLLFTSGAISELRLSSVASTSVPTEPFTLDANTISLLHFNG